MGALIPCIRSFLSDSFISAKPPDLFWAQKQSSALLRRNVPCRPPTLLDFLDFLSAGLPRASFISSSPHYISSFCGKRHPCFKRGLPVERLLLSGHPNALVISCRRPHTHCPFSCFFLSSPLNFPHMLLPTPISAEVFFLYFHRFSPLPRTHCEFPTIFPPALSVCSKITGPRALSHRWSVFPP